MSWWRRKYIGTVTGKTRWMNGGQEIGWDYARWILFIRPFGLGRAAKLIGDNPDIRSGSEQMMTARGLVEAWIKGGPLPPLDEDTKHRPGHKEPVLRMIKGGRDEE